MRHWGSEDSHWQRAPASGRWVMGPSTTADPVKGLDDNDELVFFETTAPGGEAEDKSYGATSARAVATAGSDPGQLSDAHRLQYLNFLGALDGTDRLRVDLETNRRSIAVITGVYESARTGRPVSL